MFSGGLRMIVSRHVAVVEDKNLAIFRHPHRAFRVPQPPEKVSRLLPAVLRRQNKHSDRGPTGRCRSGEVVLQEDLEFLKAFGLGMIDGDARSEEHTSELQSPMYL